MSKFTRRQILVSLASVGGLGAVGIIFRVYGPGSQHRKWVLQLERLFHNLSVCRNLGRHFLMSHAVPGEADALAARLVVGFEDHASGDFTDFFKQTIKADFLEGQTLTHDGWLISRQEAYLCALVVLLEPAEAGAQVVRAANPPTERDHRPD